MPDKRTLDEVSLDELERVVEERRRLSRAQQFAEKVDGPRFRPVTVMPVEKPAAPASRAIKRRSWRDRFLFAIEIVAVLGLTAIIVGSFVNLQALNQEVVAQVRGSGTPNPTAVSGNGETLPGSSFPPANLVSELPGSSSPPEAAPPALGIRLQSVAAVPVPTPGPRSPTRIVIPALNVDWPIVPGDGWDELKQGIGHRIGTVNPGERGNIILSGHNDVYGEPFRDLEKLEMGKDVMIYAGGTAYRYIVKSKRVVAPTDLSPLSPSRNPIATLITCTPYRVDTHRLIVVGELAP
ncbi:MAG: sortase [Chloroflexi bacterium]|nr:sortase [Chloroflexota bacterium]